MRKELHSGTHAAGKSRAGPREKDRPARPGRVKRSLREKRKQRWFLFGTATAILLLVLLAVTLLNYNRPDIYGLNMAAARESIEAGDYDSALRSLRKAAAEQESEECLLLMADCYEAQGNLDKALEILRGMEPSAADVSERILRIDEQRQEIREADKLTILGRYMEAATTDLVLDDMELSDADLREICRLYALDRLSLMNNDVADISPLAQLGGLDVLNLSGNRIRDISALAGLTELRILYLDGNPVEDLSPLYGLENLNTLSVREMELSKEQLAELTAALPGCAIYSDAEKTDASDITIGGVTFKSDVVQLDLSDRGIRDISALAECRELRWLKLGGNEISDLQPLMNIPGLESLDVSDNELVDLRPLMGLARLRTLNAANNQLMDTAALGSITSLTSLDLSGNPLTDLSGLQKLRNLQLLKLMNTGIGDENLADLGGLVLLKTLSLEGNEGISNEAMSDLKSQLPFCTILHSDLVYSTQIGEKSYPSNLVELDLSGENLTDLSGIEKLSCLETLKLSQNHLTSVYQLEYCASRLTIKYLDLSYNELTDVSAISGYSAVETVNLTGNQIKSIQCLQRLPSLKTLYVGGNPLTEEQLAAFREALPDCELITDI